VQRLVPISLLLAASISSLPAQDVNEASDPVSMSRSVLDRYYETRELISKEETDWALGKEILQDRIEMIRDQITDLKEKTSEEKTKITEADREREELRAVLEGLKEVEQLQKRSVVDLEKRIRALAVPFPAALNDRIRPLLERLPEKETPSEDIKLSISQRYQNVLGILNEVNKFHSDVLLAQERRSIRENREAEVSTLYFGLGQAFYAGSGETSEEAGVGVPGPDGFEWGRQASASEEIRALIQIYNGEGIAEFVPLPVTVK